MERGELVPDEVVVAIVADRIDQPDAAGGFVLDGFPRTVPQAAALDRLLAERGLKLDAVIELKVDEGILLSRIEKRVAEMTARGQAVRADDNADVLRGRLGAYRAQTAPLVDYYAGKGTLRSVDGMAPVDEVTGALNRILAPPKAAEAPAGGPAKPKAKAPAAQEAGQGREVRRKKPPKSPWPRRPPRKQPRKRPKKRAKKKAKKARAKASKSASAARRGRSAGAKGRSSGRKASRTAAASAKSREAQIPYQSEVDEAAINPLISSAFRSLTRCRAPERGGRVSCYALRYPLVGTKEFGASGAAGQ